MHLRRPGFTYSAGVPFTKNKERIQKFKETGDLRYIYQNELDKTCFEHYMDYGGDFKDLFRRTFPPPLLPEICYTYSRVMKLDTVLPYLKNI